MLLIFQMLGRLPQCIEDSKILHKGLATSLADSLRIFAETLWARRFAWVQGGDLLCYKVLTEGDNFQGSTIIQSSFRLKCGDGPRGFIGHH